MNLQPTEAQIDAALEVLREEVPMPYAASIDDFIASPTDPPRGPARDAALAALRSADEEAEAKNRDLVRRALVAALNANC
jgi:hypothetical protein